MQKIVQLSEKEYNDLLAYKEFHIRVIKEVVKEATEEENLKLQEIVKQCRFLNAQVYNFRETMRALLFEARNKDFCPFFVKWLFEELNEKMKKVNLTWKNNGKE